jgi:hypothetical protein
MICAARAGIWPGPALVRAPWRCAGPARPGARGHPELPLADRRGAARLGAVSGAQTACQGLELTPDVLDPSFIKLVRSPTEVVDLV